MLYLTSQVEPIDLGDEQLKASTPTKGRAPDYRLHGVMLTIMDLFAEVSPVRFCGSLELTTAFAGARHAPPNRRKR